eukprot:4340625-Pleurochrysis_carterae.AAC.1
MPQEHAVTNLNASHRIQAWCLASASDGDEHRNERLRRAGCSLKCLAQPTTLALQTSGERVDEFIA